MSVCVYIFIFSPLLANAEMQRESLFHALIEILRTISDKGKVTMVLPSEDEVFVDHSASYFHDTVTEKVDPPIA